MSGGPDITAAPERTAAGPAPESLAIIRDLIGFPTVSRDSNLDLIGYVRTQLDAHGVGYRLFENAEGTKANLLATIGPANLPGILLSGHSDVVPTEGQAWSADPFAAWEADGRLYGRGTCDMKGFLGLVLAAVPRLAASDLALPVHIAISYDEEVGCAGVGSLVDHLARLETKPRLAVVGEPTEMQIVTAHKGIRVIRTDITGKPAHSSMPEAGANALFAAAKLASTLEALGAELACERRDDRFDPPYSTVNLGRVEGGAAVNIIAEHAVLEWEFRPLPGVDADAILDRVRAVAEDEILPGLRRTAPEADIRFTEVAAAPALSAEGGEPAETFLRRLLGANRSHAVSFTTEAGLFQGLAGVPAVVCGPGSVDQAHKADEFVSLEQLGRAERMIEAISAAAERGLD